MQRQQSKEKPWRCLICNMNASMMNEFSKWAEDPTQITTVAISERGQTDQDSQYSNIRNVKS